MSFKTLLRRLKTAVRLVAIGDLSALSARALFLLRERRQTKSAFIDPPKTYAVLTPPHTLYLGYAIQAALSKAGLPCEVFTSKDMLSFSSESAPDFYFVIAAQTFKHLPPGERRIVFQVEQGVSDRWFDSRYLEILENSRATLDYSRFNLAYLAQRGIAYPHVYYAPAGGLSTYSSRQACVPRVASSRRVLFYGDASSPRRKEYLAALSERFDLQMLTNSFGEEVQQAIASAAVVVNIHFYENALLESTRIFECLSLGARVVSESAQDIEDYEGLDAFVDFAPVGDVSALVAAVERVLSELDQHQAEQMQSRALHLQHFLQQSQERFEFMLCRSLLGVGSISFEQFYKAVGPLKTMANHGAYALSLPETVARRAAFVKVQPANIEIFDGLRASPSWVGCALSYKYLSQSALAFGRESLLVCEDDVQLPEDFLEALSHIESHLASRAGRWDIFAGLIAHLAPDVEVLDVEVVGGLTFVTLNKMTSMVFNIYSRRAMTLIAAWDETNPDPHKNTIDRYLEAQPDFRVVTTLVPLFGHREDMQSSLWGVGNSQYSALIDQSRDLLKRKVQAYLQNQSDSR